MIFLTEEKKVTEVVDESDKELIRVAREDVEDDEPKEKSHKEKKRSTEGKNQLKRISLTQNIHFKNHCAYLIHFEFSGQQKSKTGRRGRYVSSTVCMCPDLF